MKIQQIKITTAQPRLDGGTQMRVALDQATIDEYAEAMEAGVEFPPIVVFQHNGDFWVADGFHRVRAARQLKRRTILAEVREGTQRDAVLYACGANAGLRRSIEDRRKAIQTLLRDPEWTSWSDAAIARACAVDSKTVGKYRGQMESTSEIRGQTERKGLDGRTINTAGISTARATRVTAAEAQDIPPDDVPELDVDDIEDPADADDGSAIPDQDEEEAEAAEHIEGESADDEDRAFAPAGPVDALGHDVPERLHRHWELLKAHAGRVEKALAEAARLWEDFQAATLKAVRAGGDAGWPLREANGIDNDFGPTGRVASLQAALRRMVPHAVCADCRGAGCVRCNHLGWFSRTAWAERQRVDGMLDAKGVAAHRS